jgi:hypothetical protein
MKEKTVRISFALVAVFILVANSMQHVVGQVTTRREAASITLTDSEGSRGEFIQQLMKFSDAKGFTMRINHIRDPRHFYIELWRADINLTVANPFNDATQFSIAFYQTTEVSRPSTEVESVISDIKDAIGGIAGVAIDKVKR